MSLVKPQTVLLLLLAIFGITAWSPGLRSIEASSTDGLQQRADTMVIRDQIACESCQIQFVRSVEFSGPDPEGVIDWPAQVAALGNEFAVWFHAFDDEIHLYDRRGRYVGPLGRPGRGPGETNNVDWLHTTRAGNLLVFQTADALTLRPTGEEIRRFNIPCCQVTGAAESPAGDLIVSASFRTPAEAGLPIHRLGDGGEIVESWGESSEAILRADHSLLVNRRLEATNEYLVAAHIIQYVIDLYTWEGQLAHRLIRATEWFPNELRGRGITPAQGPRPVLQHVAVTEDTLLWMASLVADPNYRRGIDGPYTIEGQTDVWRVVDPMAVWDTVVEIMNLRDGRLVARTRLDGIGISFVPDARLFEATQDGTGYVHLYLHEMRLKR